VPLGFDGQERLARLPAREFARSSSRVPPVKLRLDEHELRRGTGRSRSLDDDQRRLEVVVVTDVRDAQARDPVPRVEQRVSEERVRLAEDPRRVHGRSAAKRGRREVRPVVLGVPVAVEVEMQGAIPLGIFG
jgi:hypothetical protein